MNYYDDRWAIARQLDADRQAAHAMFKEHIGVARTAFRNIAFKDNPSKLMPASFNSLQISSKSACI